MAISALSLPVDIPWKRLCVSEDMLRSDICEGKSPARWKSSIAIFSYEPTEDYQTYEGETISYLKVVCTITGYQPSGEETDLKEWATDLDWQARSVELGSEYYGCHGAILEVALAPKHFSSGIPRSEFPYFIDFEPKKREMYELVSDTGETMSRSLESIAVSKGNTTSRSDEVADMLGGGSTEVSVGVMGGGGQSFTGEKGTRDINKEEYTNLRNIDEGREKRETYSHTTLLTQMYHQLTSYHLGTNRSVFFMLPRPHIVQDVRTFVNGLRLLEGIQEFFLIVMRPKYMTDFCVEAYLETAHVGQVESEAETGSSSTSYERMSVEVEPFPHKTNNVKEDFEFRRRDGGDKVELAPERATKDYFIREYVMGEGWEFDPDAITGDPIGEINPTEISAIGYECNVSVHHYPDQVNYARVEKKDEERGHLRVEASLYAARNNKSTSDIKNPDITMSTTLHLRREKVEQQIDHANMNSILFLTGRGVCCCTEKDSGLPQSGGIVGEFPIHTFNPELSMSTKDANRMRTEIGQVLKQSVNHPDRYTPGTVSFFDTRFLGRSVATILKKDDHHDNLPIDQIKGIDSLTLMKIQKKLPGALRSRLLEMSLPEAVDRFELSYDEARQFRRALLGLEGGPPTPEQRWANAESPKVPDVVGQSLSQARQAIRSARLSIGAIYHQDNEQVKDTVLQQTPEAGTEVAAKTRVNLRVASGATVQIPDIVGNTVMEGLLALSKAGLKSIPKIVMFTDKDQLDNHIVQVTPKSGSLVTPRASVVLAVSLGTCEGQNVESSEQSGAKK